MIRRILSLVIFFITLVVWTSQKSNAQEISISGNGEGASSEVVINIENNTTVVQTNEASIQNNVSENADTGENNVLANTGSEVKVETGSINTQTGITNENINTNILDNNCIECVTNFEAQITSNGSETMNEVNTVITSNINVSQNNSASITNNAVTNANTGNNTANNNNGNVEIKTGDITAITTIENKNINYNKDPQGKTNSFTFRINGNGSNSQNFINFSFGGLISVNENNYSYIFNNVLHNLNTGGNITNNNNGNVYVATGDITSLIEILNKDINKNDADICCDDPEDENLPPTRGGPNPPQEQPPILPVQPKTNPDNGKEDPDNGKGGKVLAAATGDILPVTGSYLLFLAMLFSILMFLSGVYLRFGSGISPPLKS